MERKLSNAIGALLFLRKRRRQISTENVRIAFPEKSETEIETIARGSFQSLVKVIFEINRIPIIAKDPGRYIEVQGGEHVNQALKEGKGLVVAVAHFGNWELMGISAAAQGWPIHAIGKPSKNTFVYEFIKRMRGATGLLSIDKKGAVREIVRLLKKNQMIAMLIDEHVKKGEVWVDFFGRKAATSTLPAMLSLRYGTPILPTFYYRAQTGRSILWFGKPFETIQTGNFSEDLAANTQLYVRALEDEIRRRPRDWTLWMHNRWRHEEVA